MSLVPQELRYAGSHEWVRVESNGEVTIGITEHAQHLLGDLVFVELPLVGERVTAKAEVAVVESVKAASDVYAPLTGIITAVNENLDANPGLVNTEPYTGGWLFRLKPEDIKELESLLDAKAYQQHIAD